MRRWTDVQAKARRDLGKGLWFARRNDDLCKGAEGDESLDDLAGMAVVCPQFPDEQDARAAAPGAAGRPGVAGHNGRSGAGRIMNRISSVLKPMAIGRATPGSALTS